jgi:hypothetical protein
MRLEPELEQLRVGGVVVVLLRLDPRVGKAPHLDLVAELGPGSADELGQVRDRELLGELVENPELAELTGIRHGELDALERVADVEEAAGLPALAVDGEGVVDHRLDAEPVEHRAEVLVVVEPGHQALVGDRLVGLDSVDDALVEIGGAEPPDPAREVDVVRVVDLREVVERPGQLRERQRVPAPLVLDLDEPLLDIDVGSPVLAHRPELHQVTVGNAIADREQQVEGSDHVRVLGLDRGLTRLHRIRRRGLLAVVDDRLGQRLGDHAVEEAEVLDRPDERPDLVARHLAPRLDAVGERPDRGQRVG